MTRTVVEPHLQRLLDSLAGVRPRDRGFNALCPAHPDQHPSLDIDVGDDGRLLLICRSRGCSAEAICAAIGLEERDLFADGGHRSNGMPPPRHRQRPEQPKPTFDSPEAYGSTLSNVKRRFDYHDESGELIYVTFRIEPPGQRKLFLPVHRQADGKWMGTHMPAPRVLYRLPQLLAAKADEPVLVVEGEGKVEAAVALGWTATCSAGGAKAADRTDWSVMKNRTVVVLNDADEAGVEYANDVVRLTRAAGVAHVRVLRLPGLKTGSGHDLVDWIALKESEGLDRDEIGEDFARLIEATMDDTTDSTAEREPKTDAQPRRLFCRPYELAQTKRDWLVRRLLARGELGLLFGGWGTFKSFNALHLAQAIVDGGEFLGMPVRQGTVAYIAGEGAGGIANRLRAAFGCARFADRNDPLHERLWIASKMPPLTRKDGFDRIVAEVEAMPALPDLLVIDTWARACGAAGADPNKPADAGQVLDACDRLRQKFFGLTELVLVHTPNDRNDRPSGWYGLPAAADLELAVAGVGPSTDLACCVEVKKLRDGEAGQKLLVRLAQVVVDEDEDGQVTSLRVDTWHRETAAEAQQAKAPHSRQQILDAADEAGEDGISLSEASRAASKKDSTASYHLKALVRDGRLQSFTSKQGKKRWRKLGGQP